MPPKAAQKPKAEPPKAKPSKKASSDKQSTPVTKTTSDKQAAPVTKTTSGKKSSPAVKPVASKKPKDSVLFSHLERETGTAIPIDVTFEGESNQSKPRKAGGYGHALKLSAPGAFSLVKSVVIPEGEYQGLQAILLRPAKPFNFLKLPEEARKRVYTFYFANKGVLNGEIVLEGKRKDSKEIYAKNYANGSENRVALLAVNKEVYTTAIKVLYANTIRLENTTTLLDFLSQIPANVRPLLTSIAVKSFVKTTSRNAMHFLAEASSLQRLHIDAGVYSDGDPEKAAKSFYLDAHKFLEAVAARKGDKTAGVDVLTFGPMAFVVKDEQKKARAWSEEMVEEFRETLRGKLK